MKKRLLAILLSACMIFALTACGGEDTTPPAETNAPVDTEAPADTEAPVESSEATETEDPTPAGNTIVVIPGVFEYDASRILYRTNFDEYDLDWDARETKKEQGIWDPREVGDDEEHSAYNQVLENFGTTYITLEVREEASPAGSKSLFVGDRHKDWSGATINLTDIFNNTIWEYEMYAWVKVPEGQPESLITMSYQLEERLGDALKPQYKQWDDFDSDEGVLSKRRLPTSLYDPDSDNWEVQYNIDYVDGEWMLLRGIATIIAVDWEEIHVYIEGGFGDFYIGEVGILKV